MIGAISEATDLPVTTAVTCPTVRIHPAVIVIGLVALLIVGWLIYR